MNKTIYYFSILCAFFSAVVSCTKEDGLAPSGIQEDYFTVPADATDSISVMRRAFYERNKVHLLFNDTLRHELQGAYADGTPYWYTEVVDLNWFMTTSSDDEYVIEYLTDNYRNAIEFVEEYMLPHLTKDFRPYSVFPVDQLYIIDSYYNEIAEEDFCNSFRCLAVSVGKIAGMTEDEKAGFCQSIFYNIVYNKLENFYYGNDPVLDDFWVFSKDYYYVRYRDIEGLKDLPSVTKEDLYSYGFIYAPRNYTPGELTDLRNYAQAMFTMDEQEFKETYDHPVVHRKYEVLKQIIIDLGFKF